MGYMGFGMQNWIFKQKPRRPFSKDRKPSGDTINNTEWGDLHIGGIASHNIELAEQEKIEFMQKIAKIAVAPLCMIAVPKPRVIHTIRFDSVPE